MRTLLAMLCVCLLGASTPAYAQKQSSATRAKLCELQKQQLGLPIVFDAELKAKLVEKMGEKDAANLIRPIARANIAHRCLCGKDPAFKELNCG